MDNINKIEKLNIYYNKKKLNVIYKETVDSTNTFADKLSKRDDKEYLIIADTQTKGKGQRKNLWFSPKSIGLYFSIILKRLPTKNIINEPVFWGEKVKKTIEKLVDVKCSIKPPNDVLIDNKKVAGVLLESKIIGNICKTLIIGIGVNINNKKNDFSDELKKTATSLYLESGKKIDRVFFLQNFFTVVEKD